MTYPHTDPDFLDALDDAYGSAPAPEPQSSEFSPIPSGTYQARVERCQIKDGKPGKPQRVTWGLKIAGPSHAGRWVWRDYPLAPDFVAWLKGDLYALGRQEIRPSSFVRDPYVRASLCDLTVNIKVQHRADFPDSPRVFINSLVTASRGGIDERNPPPMDDSDIPF